MQQDSSPSNLHQCRCYEITHTRRVLLGGAGIEGTIGTTAYKGAVGMTAVTLTSTSMLVN
eukprot:6206948-Karenia_brevis.AAC.1